MGMASLQRRLLVLCIALTSAVGAFGARQLQQGQQDTTVPGAGPQNAPDPFAEELVPDELIVQYAAGASDDAKGRAIRGQGQVNRVLRQAGPDSGELVLVKVLPEQASDRAKLKATAAIIAQDKSVVFAEPNFIVKALQSPSPTNDPRVGELWGMLNSAAGAANAVGAWNQNYTDCSNVYIGVIDEGIDDNHEDLAANMWVNPAENLTADGVDNDGNGRIDDIHGWDFVYNDASVYDGAGVDDHGTHVAGTIGAVGNNTLGVVGVCQSGIKLISAKFLGPNGGSIANAISAMNYLLDLKNRHNLSLVATSNSWGGGGYSQAMYDAIQAHANNNILFIAAAGNSNINSDVSPQYPASYTVSNVIAVGALDSSGARASYSNFGATTVDIFAPGSSILSTWGGSTYRAISGTSMATPHVSGAAALYAASFLAEGNPIPSAATIKNAIMTTAKPNVNVNGRCVTNGQLEINALLNLRTPPPPPPPATTMTTQISASTAQANSRTKDFTCTFVVTVKDNNGAAVSGAQVQGSVSISPNNGDTRFPYPVNSATGTAGTVSFTTPAVASSKGRGSAGTSCRIDVSNVTHSTLTLDRAGSTLTASTAPR